MSSIKPMPYSAKVLTETIDSIDEHRDFGIARYKVSSSLEERLYVLTDNNHDVTAITDVFGNVKERFIYDPYGTPTVLNSSWSSTSDSYAWAILFQGKRFDTTTQTYDFDHRVYKPSLGTFIQADPLGYPDGASRYQMEAGIPITSLDGTGLRTKTFGGIPGPETPGVNQDVEHQMGLPVILDTDNPDVIAAYQRFKESVTGTILLSIAAFSGNQIVIHTTSMPDVRSYGTGSSAGGKVFINPLDQIGVDSLWSGHDIMSIATSDAPDGVQLGTDLAAALAHEFTHALAGILGLDGLLGAIQARLSKYESDDFKQRWNGKLDEWLAVLVENSYRDESQLPLRARYALTPDQDYTLLERLSEGAYGPPLIQRPSFPDLARRGQPPLDNWLEFREPVIGNRNE